ncbi:BBT_HP_G0130180.mRNA.1.CDS.1 [Saccharomyces cerevisiae]|nr:BBT_HP_G0095000.mRNA.1.CDS.1 [Saccharomyces cerevisiae]CAI5100077.1 BBT_HP_G0130180.mRNA.1.CDS.1 [Saccharomyces cerevisiae]CAI6933511.1 BBT_HP_G0095000.mRNA.1.CDS.1 [Saccharomyces cerevisiae]CAI6973893.1 BBT_HP_G0130180.mRNA.1.CDS.1 [Saccharomyces cerevisiae]
MTEARMNSKNVPIGCQDTSDPHFNGPIDQHVPGAGSPQSQPHHIDAWNSVSSRRADNNNQDMMDPQTASSDRYNEKMMREENSGVSASSYTTKVQGYPATIAFSLLHKYILLQYGRALSASMCLRAVKEGVRG